MTTSDLLTPAEVAALFRVDAKTVTRWAKDSRLASIRTLGGHRRYRAAEVYALLDSERWSGRHAPATTLVNDHYEGDPARALRDLARRYGIAIIVLDRDWFTQVTGRDLTDDEWKLIAAELAMSSNAPHDACAHQLFDYAGTVLSTAGIAAEDTGSQPESPPGAIRRGQSSAGSADPHLQPSGSGTPAQPTPVQHKTVSAQFVLSPQSTQQPMAQASPGAGRALRGPLPGPDNDDHLGPFPAPRTPSTRDGHQ